MDISAERILGELTEFKDWATCEFANLRHGQSLVLEKIEKINEARFILYGKLAMINSALVICIEVVTHNLFK
jgi:hypothetical protein